MGSYRKVMFYIHKESMPCNSINSTNSQVWRNNNLFLIQRNKVVFFAENEIIWDGLDFIFVKIIYLICSGTADNLRLLINFLQLETK